MPKVSLFLFLMIASLFSGEISAQKSGRKKKHEKPGNNGYISIYENKKLVYRFSRSEYLLFRDSIHRKTKDRLHKINEFTIEWKPAKEPSRPLAADPLSGSAPEDAAQATRINIYRDDRLVRSLGPSAYRKFKDSIVHTTKDTLYAIGETHVEIHPYSPAVKAGKPKPSVFVNAQGYVAVSLPMAKVHSYRLVFLADATELFQLTTISETDLVLDKTNFIHAGWFSYELFENGKLTEKGRLFLPK